MPTDPIANPATAIARPDSTLRIGSIQRSHPADIAVVYLARGGEAHTDEALQRFAASYGGIQAGCRHSFYVIYKNFETEQALERARALFAPFNPGSLFVEDAGLDIGAYRSAANELNHPYLCFLNTHSEILAEGWLQKMAVHIRRPEMGMVGATGSFECLEEPESTFPSFPNVHLRSNAFLIRGDLFRKIGAEAVIRDKRSAHLFESGSASLTRGVIARGYDVAIVGRNGRAYPPRWWPGSDTFRQVEQGNLLIADNKTRDYIAAPLPERRTLAELAWGSYVEADDLLPPDLQTGSLANAGN